MKVIVCGDLCLTGEPEKLVLGTSDYDLWAGVDSLAGRDSVVVANVEFALTARGQPRPYKWATLRASPACVSALKRMQVAVVGNNHVSDYGDVGAQDTVDCLAKAGITTVGYGVNLEAALRPAVVEQNGILMAILSLSCPTTNGENLATITSPGVAPLSLDLLRTSITDARSKADAVLVCLHWGVEHSHDPVPDQIRLAHRAAEWGADAVVGCHAHVIQSYERYQGRWIFYGLGNFLFGPIDTLRVMPDGSHLRGRQEQMPANRESLAIQFRVDPNCPEGRLELEAIHPLAFGQEYVPRPIARDSLKVDLDRANSRLMRYAELHREALRRDTEPVLRAIPSKGGKMDYFYVSEPIRDVRAESPFRRHLLRLRRALGNGLRSLGW